MFDKDDKSAISCETGYMCVCVCVYHLFKDVRSPNESLQQTFQAKLCVYMACMALITAMVLCATTQDSLVSINVPGTVVSTVRRPFTSHLAYQCLDLS